MTLVPMSRGAVRSATSFEHGEPIRLSFVPFGNRQVGDDDPGAPGYQVLDGSALRLPSRFAYVVKMIARTGLDPALDVVRFEDISGRRFIVADGEAFTANSDVDWPDDIDPLDLGDCGPVVAVKHDDGNGYVAVGTRAVVLSPR